MNASRNSLARKTAKWGLAISLALTALGATGCDELSLSVPLSSGYPLSAATQNVPSWGGWAQPQYTSAMGLPESPWSYWARFFGG